MQTYPNWFVITIVVILFVLMLMACPGVALVSQM